MNTELISTVIAKENRAVVINQNHDGGFFANLYINTRNGIENADISSQRWTGKTMSGATRWANRVVGK